MKERGWWGALFTALSVVNQSLSDTSLNSFKVNTYTFRESSNSTILPSISEGVNSYRKRICSSRKNSFF